MKTLDKTVNDCLTWAPLYDKQKDDSLSDWVKAYSKISPG